MPPLRVYQQIQDFVDYLLANFFISVFTWIALVFFTQDTFYSWAHATGQFWLFFFLSTLTQILTEVRDETHN